MRNETLADIIYIMRSEPLYNPHGDPALVEANKVLRNFADRIEAAAKREISQAAEDAASKATLDRTAKDAAEYLAYAMAHNSAPHCNAAAMRDTHGAAGEGWYGFDLDGTLAKYDGWKGIDNIGAPVMPMVKLIKRLHKEGKIVKVMTARVAPKERPETRPNPYFENNWCVQEPDVQAWALKDKWTPLEFIQEWCYRILGFVPEIVYQKDHLMLELFDDRVKQVVPNAGILVEDLAAQAGNAAMLRNALKQSQEMLEDIGCFKDVLRIVESNKIALSAPPRNCDRFATEAEARKAFYNCYFGPTEDEFVNAAFIDWLFSTEGGAK